MTETEPQRGPEARLSMVLEAAEAIRPYVVRTPLVLSRFHTERFGFPVYLKLENLQVTGAFKVRGAMNAVLALKMAGTRHVIAPSSGSHAMGVAFAARVSGLKATIVMSEASSTLKREKVLAYGAELVIDGANFEESYRFAVGLARRTGAALVSGIEDEMVMAGQGTMGLEILEDLPGVDFVAVPIGGGGAISGLLMALKGWSRAGVGEGGEAAAKPSARGTSAIEVWGVQATGAPSMKVSLERGKVTQLAGADTIADAIAVRRPGVPAFHLVKALADGVTTVDDDRMLKAVGRLALEDKVVVEPAGAAPLAVDWEPVLGRRPRAAAFIVTGGNITRELLARAIAG